MDYRKLLKKYIAHVGYEEGTTFIHSSYSDDTFTPQELAELEKLEAESLEVN